MISPRVPPKSRQWVGGKRLKKRARGKLTEIEVDKLLARAVVQGSRCSGAWGGQGELAEKQRSRKTEKHSRPARGRSCLVSPRRGRPRSSVVSGGEKAMGASNPGLISPARGLKEISSLAPVRGGAQNDGNKGIRVGDKEPTPLTSGRRTFRTRNTLVGVLGPKKPPIEYRSPRQFRGWLYFRTVSRAEPTRRGASRSTLMISRGSSKLMLSSLKISSIPAQAPLASRKMEPVRTQPWILSKLDPCRITRPN